MFAMSLGDYPYTLKDLFKVGIIVFIAIYLSYLVFASELLVYDDLNKIVIVWQDREDLQRQNLLRSYLTYGLERMTYSIGISLLSTLLYVIAFTLIYRAFLFDYMPIALYIVFSLGMFVPVAINTIKLYYYSRKLV